MSGSTGCGAATSHNCPSAVIAVLMGVHLSRSTTAHPSSVCRLELCALVPDDDLPATVAALSKLSPQVQLSLAFCTSPVGSLSGMEHEFCDPVDVPSLAGIQCLHELRLEGNARPPPDWSWLWGLSALRVNPLPEQVLDDVAFSFPHLTRLECTFPAVPAGVC